MNSFARYGNNVSAELQQERSWAVVTGASDGIGKAYCHLLAERGFNIVLVARNQEKLDKVAAEITGVQTRVVVQDLSQITSFEKAQELVQKIPEDLDVGILINNAGYADIGPFFDHEPAEIESILNLNTLALVFITKALLPRLERKTFRSGIINVSSCAGTFPLVGMLAYSISKISVSYLSQGLAFEL